MKKFFLAFLSLFFSSAFSQTNVIDSITSLLKTDKEDTNKVNHLNELSWEHKTIGQYDSALYYAYTALDLANLIVNETKTPTIKQTAQKGIAVSYRRIGNVYDDQGDYPKALEWYFKSLKIDEEFRDKNGISSSLNNIGIVYKRQGDYAKALEYYFKALKISEELGNKNFMASNLGNIGNVYDYQGDHPKALDYYFKALKLNEEIGNKNGIAANLGNIGIVYDYQGDYPKALEYYFKALKIHEELENKNGIAGTLNNIGTLYTIQMKYKEAEEYLLKAMEISTEIEALDLIKDHHKALSELYSKTNRYQLAYEHYKLFSAAKDSLFNEDKSKEIGRLEMRHEIEIAETERTRKVEEELKIKTQKTERRNLLEYSGMVIGLIIIGLFVSLLGFVKVKPWVAEGITFFVFLLFFEFLLVLLDPYMDKFTKGEPAYKLFINAGVALCIFPLHAFFEKMLKRRLMKKK